ARWLPPRAAGRGLPFFHLSRPGRPGATPGTTPAGTKSCCDQTALPVAGLLTDLASRGLLDSTLVFWGGEFGRTPGAQNRDGRDHHPYGFSVWLAGGSIRGGRVHGATDDFGYHAAVDRCKVADLHATMLHLLGLDYERLTYLRHGRDERLTDVYEPRLLRDLM